ncbi:MAG: hypothetical protein L3J63_05045 [Geopsychrobacter sp.]|nr:hypothetical protein [Geopsychrobacter sp.]
MFYTTGMLIENKLPTTIDALQKLCLQQQTVIKGLSKFIGNVSGVSGCTILGDGGVSLILDIGGLRESVAGKNKNQLQDTEA